MRRTKVPAWQQTDASTLRSESSLPPSATSQKRQTRRRLIALLASTGQAQIETHELPDGSRLGLAARSEVAIAYHRDRRLANLVAGEVRFDVKPDAQRPFEIETPHGRVRVLGTAFSVRLLEDGLRVAVARGRVGAWRQGWLVFEGIPLDKAIDSWNDYLANPLEMERRSGLANMRLTGSFPIDNPLAFLEALPRTHPVEVIAHGNGRFLIRQRSTAERNEK
jgi:transmembrane sensor